MAAGAALGSDAEPFFEWAVKGVETQATQDPVRLSIHLSVVSIALQLGQRDCMKPLVSKLLARLNSLLETVSHYQMVTPLVQTIQVLYLNVLKCVDNAHDCIRHVCCGRRSVCVVSGLISCASVYR